MSMKTKDRLNTGSGKAGMLLKTRMLAESREPFMSKSPRLTSDAPPHPFPAPAASAAFRRTLHLQAGRAPLDTEPASEAAK